MFKLQDVTSLRAAKRRQWREKGHFIILMFTSVYCYKLRRLNDRLVKYVDARLVPRLIFDDHVAAALKEACGVRAKLFPTLSYYKHLALRTKVTLHLLFLILYSPLHGTCLVVPAVDH